MKPFFLFIGLVCLQFPGCSQQTTASQNGPQPGEQQVGGRCEGCEAIYECPVPFSELDETDTISDFMSAGPKIEITGRILMPDGKTPATGVVMYFYHTDQKGIYPTKGGETGWEKRHGYLRGWIKTDKNGFYRFYTLRPASYPNSRALAHIHATIKEPGKSAYYIDDFLFADDPFLSDQSPNPSPRGGSGILHLTKVSNDYFTGKRDIVLGRNVY